MEKTAFNQSLTECLTDGDGDGFSPDSAFVFIPEEFCYDVDMYDTAGDGWHTNALDFYVDGTLQTSVTLIAGSSGTDSLCLTASEVEVVWSAGSFANEIAFAIYDDAGTLLQSASGHGSGTYLLDVNSVPIINQGTVFSEMVTGSVSVLDCDDTDISIFTGAVELENGFDDDCDGVIDNDTNVYDDDGDTFSENDGDCDDGDASIFPGAVELENGLDDDCDTIADNNTNVYDDDGDGYTENDGDCDDTDFFVNPFATEVINNVDDDCDGVVDNTSGSSPNAVPDFSLPDTNPSSPTVGQTISPSDYLQEISGWYFIKST